MPFSFITVFIDLRVLLYGIEILLTECYNHMCNRFKFLYFNIFTLL